MANFQTAINYVLSNEGENLYDDPESGELSKFGISLRWLRTVQYDATPDTIRNLTRDAAIGLYQRYWWMEINISQITSDRVATKLLDAAVNMGAETAIKILQETLNEPADDPADRIAVDGIIGPQTIRAIQHDCGIQYGEGEDALLAAFAVNLVDRYKEIAANMPELAKNLAGWEARAEKLPV